VESIEYWPAEKIPERMQAEKDSIVDVCCKDNKNREFIVEMQMTWTDSFKKRVLLNASKAYVAQSKKGDEFALLQPVYALNFVNAEFMKDVDDYYHYYHLVHDKYTNKVIDGLHLVFVELPKFKPQSFSERKMQVLWLRFLTEINDETREVPAELLENAEVNEALEIIERAAFSDAEMRAYDKFWDNVSVQKTLDNARKREINEAKREVAEAKREVVEAKREVVEAKREVVEAKREVVEAKREAERTIAEAKAEVAEAKREAERAIEEAKTETAEAKAGVAEAKAKVEAKLKQKDIDTARKLKELSLPFEQIAEITGLTLEQIEAL
jgi:predicted transposase/invertase (TIGR01784 family)